eukprot:g1233.t1
MYSSNNIPPKEIAQDPTTRTSISSEDFPSLAGPEKSSTSQKGGPPDLSKTALLMNQTYRTKMGGGSNDFKVQKSDFPALPLGGVEKKDSTNPPSTNSLTLSGEQDVKQEIMKDRLSSKSSLSSHKEGGATEVSGQRTSSHHYENKNNNHHPQSEIDSSTPVKNTTSPESYYSHPCSLQEAQSQLDQYGMLGLVNMLQDRTNVAKKLISLGTDLNQLGLDLNSPDPVFNSIGFSPLSVHASSGSKSHGNYKKKSSSLLKQQNEEYPITSEYPTCYYMTPPSLKTSHLSKFKLEVLFWIFYSMPNDILQVYASKELYNRGWKYHTKNGLWFEKYPILQDDNTIVSKSGAGTSGNSNRKGGGSSKYHSGNSTGRNRSTTRRGVGGERYQYFNVEGWKIDEYMYDEKTNETAASLAQLFLNGTVIERCLPQRKTPPPSATSTSGHSSS